MKINIVTGPPGSGKTTHAEDRRQELEATGKKVLVIEEAGRYDEIIIVTQWQPAVITTKVG